MKLNNWRICDEQGIILHWIATPDGKEYDSLKDFSEEELEKLAKTFWDIGWGTEGEEFDFDAAFSTFKDLFDRSTNPKKMKALKQMQTPPSTPLLIRNFPTLVGLMNADWYPCPNVDDKIGIANETWMNMNAVKNEYIHENGRYIVRKIHRT